jgi:uncharacterized membrane protein
LAAIAFFRRRSINPGNQVQDPLLWFPPRDTAGLWKLLLTTLGFIGVLALSMELVDVSTHARESPPFTEFYLLDPKATTSQYPISVQVGQPADVLVGIINHERNAVHYSIVLSVDNSALKRVASVSLGNSETWEQIIQIPTDIAKGRQKVDLLLFREGDNQPYRTLHIWMTILDLPRK